MEFTASLIYILTESKLNLRPLLNHNNQFSFGVPFVYRSKNTKKGYSRSEINCYSSKYSEPFGRKIVRLITSCFHVVLYNK